MLDNQQSNPTSTAINAVTKDSNSTPVTYQQIQSIIADDFEIMDKQVYGSLSSKVKLVMSVSQHVINAGGKRMRPLISLLCSRICNDQPSQAAMHLGAITEMLHTATLVHDDVIDASGMRRGKPTANATWDNATAVLVGDYLIARSLIFWWVLARCRYCSYSQMALVISLKGKYCSYNISMTPKLPKLII